MNILKRNQRVMITSHAAENVDTDAKSLVEFCKGSRELSTMR